MMNRPTIYVCESFANDYKKAATEVAGNDILIKPFPCLCCDMGKRALAKRLVLSDENDKILLCGNSCPLLNDINSENSEHTEIITKTNNYCFHHFIDKRLIEYIVEKGGYIVTNGWLKSWRSRLAHEGFDQTTARRFYGEFCNEIVFLDTHTEEACLSMLQEFSDYIGIPYLVIDAGLDLLKLYLDQTIKEWQINSKAGLLNDLNTLRREKAEYETILKIIEQITNSIQKRAILEKVQELFQVVFGAREIQYLESGDVFNEFDVLLISLGDNLYMNHTENYMIVRFGTQLRCFGIMKVNDFLFPESVNRYISLAKSIVRVSSLAIANALQFEMIEKSRDEVAYLSNHDALTNLYNRNYFDIYTEENELKLDVAVFVCDIDGLKSVNDNLGHILGDELIISAAHVLHESFRETDVIARVGGDEFYIIMNNCTMSAAQTVKSRIKDSIKAYNQLNLENPYVLSMSVGMYHSEECSIKKVWKMFVNIADERMYAEKAEKKIRTATKDL